MGRGRRKPINIKTKKRKKEKKKKDFGRKLECRDKKYLREKIRSY